MNAVAAGPSAPALSPAAPPAVRLERLHKRYGAVVAVDGVDLDVRAGEFFSFLGPSGSGKTTTLRLIAGFEQPSEGRVMLSGRDVAGEPPYARDVNTVFQDYALFPHMDVAANVGYPLMIRHIPRAARADRVAAALRMVRLDGFERRRPAQLSGGQRQRVALARALIGEPRVLLLDEPLGALDLKLRQEMQVELKSIQQRVGITFIYVTHDQDEALAMSDRLAVFNSGRIEQVGTPADVYERPRTSFVAQFVGTANLITGQAALAVLGQDGQFSLRPERIRLVEASAVPADGDCTALGRVRDVVYLGSDTRFLVELDAGLDLTVIRQNASSSAVDALAMKGVRVRLIWARAHVRPVSSPAT